MGGDINLDSFRQDPYRAAAAAALDKQYDDVSGEERRFFKEIVLHAIYGRRYFLGIGEEQMSFEEMYSRQRLFTRRVLCARGLDLDDLGEQERTDLTREYLLSLHSELTEVLEKTDWKKHRSQPEKKNYPNVAREIIDVQKFLWGLSLIWGIQEEEFCKEFSLKSTLVEQRFDQELKRKFDEEVKRKAQTNGD